MPRLTDPFIRSIPKPEQHAKIVYDDKLMGFGIRITPNDVRTFILRYRNAQGTERKVAIGRWDTTSGWSAAAAREEAQELRMRVDRKEDPQAARIEAREALTVNGLLDLYVDSPIFKAKADTTQAIDKGRLNRHVRPLLGKRVVMDLTPDAIERAFADIVAGKTAKVEKTKKRGKAVVRGGEGTARKAVRLLRAAFNWGVRNKHIEANPAKDVDTGKDGVRKLMLSTDQYLSLFTALDMLEADGTIKPVEADCFRVVALTGARRGEVLGLRPAHINRAEGIITLPASGHKTGKTTGEERVIGLPEAALDILDKWMDGELVFPIDSSAYNEAWRQIRTAAKLPADFVPHGLRHSVASNLARDGAGAPQIMQVMGHRDMRTSQKYIHWLTDDLRKQAERAAGPALAALNRSPRADAAE